MDRLWKASGFAVGGGPAEPQAVGERAMEIRCRLAAVLSGRLDRCSLGVPQIDVKRFDLLDQQEDGLAGGAQLVAFGVREARAPTEQLVDLVFVQTLAQRSSRALTTVTIDRYDDRCS